MGSHAALGGIRGNLSILQIMNNDNPPAKSTIARKVNTGISSIAIFIIGQFIPQKKVIPTNSKKPFSDIEDMIF